MNKIKILDCTLRDGGYVNDWNFGERTIRKIIDKLVQANTDIIECGFLTDKGGDKNKSLFNDIKNIKSYIEPKHSNIMYVGMIAYPNNIINNIPQYDGNCIDGIRVTFHENEIDEALPKCKELIDKGYKVFIQPVGITSYSDISIINLINKVNKINPYAFYIVDTLGQMYKNDLLRMFYLIDNNLDKSINIGFHSHNNLQLSFSNAQELMSLHTNRNIILDTSVFGMGRGAGNLCTELVAQYINDNIEKKYNIESLLEIIDEHLNSVYSKYPWGYSAPYCLAAINNCHPNYASYLIEKQTITIKAISSILKTMNDEKRTIYDRNYIEEVYIEYQKHYIDDKEELEKIKECINERKVLILAPGRSINEEYIKIKEFISKYNPFIISINFISEEVASDFLFISNLKRFEGLSDVLHSTKNKTKVIITSNIDFNKENVYSIMNYTDLIVDNSVVSDNAGLMLINLLKRLSISEVFIAGFDGYNINEDNYSESDLELVKTKENIESLNFAIKQEINNISKSMDIKFITNSKYN